MIAGTCGMSGLLACAPHDLAALAPRVFPAAVVRASGRTNVEGVAIAPSTWYRFKTDDTLPLIPPQAAAVMAVGTEHLFPVLLVLGPLTRASALSLPGLDGDRPD